LAGSETQECLKCGRGSLATIMPKDEFVEVDLELVLADSVVGADQPLLEVSNGPISEWDSGLRAFA